MLFGAQPATVTVSRTAVIPQKDFIVVTSRRSLPLIIRFPPPEIRCWGMPGGYLFPHHAFNLSAITFSCPASDGS
jgi:ADP-ribose pyrophosphatase YjhB (NUDIX family)